VETSLPERAGALIHSDCVAKGRWIIAALRLFAGTALRNRTSKRRNRTDHVVFKGYRRETEPRIPPVNRSRTEECIALDAFSAPIRNPGTPERHRKRRRKNLPPLRWWSTARAALPSTLETGTAVHTNYNWDHAYWHSHKYGYWNGQRGYWHVVNGRHVFVVVP
jgi:hypothetical protein